MCGPDEADSKSARAYLESLQDSDGVLDELYLAIIDHHDAAEAETAYSP